MVFTVDLKANPAEGVAPLKTTFTGTISDYAAPLEWVLIFEDGTGAESGTPPAPPTFTVIHTYEKPGTYTPYLGAHDAAGHEAFARITITVLSKTWRQQLQEKWDSLSLWQKLSLVSIIPLAVGSALIMRKPRKA